MADATSRTDGSLVAAIVEEVDDASTDEAAAIASAITTHLSDRERAAAAAAAAAARDSGPNWTGRKWAFAGRLSRNGRSARRIPEDAPASEWAAAGRSDRF